jgi:PAS domain S-box-containing protein
MTMGWVWRLRDLLGRSPDPDRSARAKEEQYRALFDNSVSGIGLHEVVVDAAGTPIDYVFLDVNRAFEELTGLRREQVLGRRVTEVLPGIEKTPFIEVLGRVALSGEPVRFEQFSAPLGRHYDIAAFSWKRGQFAAVFQDVTARREAEERLRLQGAALEAAANAIVITDREGRITWANPAFTRLTGWEAAEILGQNPRILKSGQHPPAFYEDLWRTIRSGRVWRGEMVNRRRDGSPYFEEQTITPVRDRENGEITHFVGIKVDVTERRQSREALLQSERRYRTLAEAAHDHIFIVDRAGQVQYVNTAGAASLGLRPEDVSQKQLEELFPAEVAKEFRDNVDRVVASGEDVYVEERTVAGGREAWMGTWLAPLKSEGGEVEAVVGVSRDLTEHRSLERQVQQSQKMEAIGLLARGVAHDFNNLLSVVGGYSELALKRLPEGDPLRRNLMAISQASRRAADLTRQLLALSRQQVVAPTVLDLDDVVKGMEEMLRRLIPEDIDLGVVPKAGKARVKADRGQIDQLVMNLVVNARDAMPEGGRLLIETAEIELDDVYCRSHVGARPGPHVMLAVSDTGSGMDPETQSHIFEPFFTTKEAGRGTGLGLSTVYGIVKQAGGSVFVYSEPGRGSVFKLFLPRVDEELPLQTRPAPSAGDSVRGGTETILLVEDEEALRTLTCEVLESFGYAVLPACGGAEALAQSERHSGPHELMISDMVMPGVNGQELAFRLAQTRPRTRVLFVSGYAEEGAQRQGPDGERVSFLQKPFTSEALGRRVREILDGP